MTDTQESSGRFEVRLGYIYPRCDGREVFVNCGVYPAKLGIPIAVSFCPVSVEKLHSVHVLFLSVAWKQNGNYSLLEGYTVVLDPVVDGVNVVLVPPVRVTMR